MRRRVTDQPTHFFCSSGGNAGLACVHAAVALDQPSTIVVPTSTSEYMIQKLRDAGAEEVVQIGVSWFEADQHLKQVMLPKVRESGINAVYVHPFDEDDIWHGHATMVEEIADQLPTAQKHYPVDQAKPEQDGKIAPDAIVCSVGGGGLFSGIMEGLKSTNLTDTKVVAVETVGAASLYESLQENKLITLPAITSIATTLGARTVAKQAFAHASGNRNVRSVVMSDADAIMGCKEFLENERILVEPSCGVSLALCYTDQLREVVPELTPQSHVVVIVCGGSGISMEILDSYTKQFLSNDIA